MNKKVVVIGAGGYAKVVADIVLESGDNIVGFLDEYNPVGEFLGYPKLGNSFDYKKHSDLYYIVAVGDSYVRERIVQGMCEVKWYTAVHPQAIISKIDTDIGEGTVIMANAIVNPGTKIGKHCIINTGSIVEHDNVISDYVHISVGSKTAGGVFVGERTWLGVGSTVINQINICNDCFIGAGATVIKDISNSGKYVGVPARRIDD